MILRKIIKGVKITMLIALLIAAAGGIRQLNIEYKDYKAAQIEEDIKDATVQLGVCVYRNSCAGGTGFVVSQTEQGAFIVTNKHVCSNGIFRPEEQKKYGQDVYRFGFVEVTRRGGKKSPGQIIKVSQNADLCLIYTPSKFKHTLKIAKSYKIGEVVSSYGFPSGGPVYLKGVIKKHDPYWLGIYNESNMLAWYGISGSAVINGDGEVVGVMSNILTSEQRNGPAKDRSKVYGSLFVPLELLREFIGGI